MKKIMNALDKSVFFVSVTTIILVTVILFIFPEQSKAAVDRLMHFMTYRLGFLYIMTYVLLVVFLIWLVFSRYGKVVLGKSDEKPEYDDFSWMAMMFCTGIASGLMIFSFVEPIYYLASPPFGIEPMSVKAYEYAHMYGQFHWGPSAWLFYVPATLAIGYALFAQGSDSVRLGDVCYRSGFLKGGLHKIIDIITVFAVLGGIGTSMGLASPLVCEIISRTFHIPNDNNLMMAVFLLWFIIFATSVWRGLDKGIKTLSNINIYAAVVFIVIIVFVAGVGRVFDVELNSLGIYFTEFFHMSFNTDPFGQMGFPQNWTVFYWGWWLSYIPIMGLFTARISRGRTIRSTILGMIGYGSLGCVLSFASLGCYALDLQKNGVLDLVTILSTQGKEAAVVAILDTLPLHNVMSVAFAVVCIIFMATTIDSSAYILASATTKSLHGDEQPARWNRIFWAIIFLVFAIALTKIGGLETMQTASVLAGFPMIFVCAITVYVLYRMLKKGRNEETDASR